MLHCLILYMELLVSNNQDLKNENCDMKISKLQCLNKNFKTRRYKQRIRVKRIKYQ